MSTFSSEHRATFRTLTEALYAAPAERPFVTMWKSEDDLDSVTFGEFRRRVAIQAARMLNCGARPDDTIVLIMPQGIPLMTAFLGAITIGAVPAILAYPNFKVEPAKYRAGLAGVTRNLKARLVVVDETLPEELMSHLDTGGRTRVIRSIDSPADDAEQAPAGPSLNPDKIAFIQHSAGTTGLQKGVALSHSAVLRQLGHLASVLKLDPRDRIYSWLPLYHDMGLIACFMLPITYHLPVIMQAPDDWVIQPVAMLKLITHYRCTLTWVPNFTLQFLARRVRLEDRADLDLSSLRAIINCSEPVRDQSLDEFAAAYSHYGLHPNAMQSSYAMAENVFAVTQSNPEAAGGPARIWVDGERFRNEHCALPVAAHSVGGVCFVSSGRCLPGNEVRILAENGRDLPDGAIGEILIRSDSLFEGYYNRPDTTAAALKEGWYWSGDLGFVWDGELYVIGRRKDLIIVAGKNIHPHDVEEIISKHPDIHDGRVVAFGLYNAALGTEDIVAVAELHDEGADVNAMTVERSVRSAVVAELGVALRKLYLKPPRWLVKSTAGKPARTATRDKLLAEHRELEDPA